MLQSPPQETSAVDVNADRAPDNLILKGGHIFPTETSASPISRRADGRVSAWLGLGITLSVLAPRAAHAQVWVKPEIGFQTGATDFELSLEQVSGSRDARVRSLLEWPVNFWLAGIEAGTSFKAARSSDRWLLEGRLDTNLGDAYGKMEDSDWISSRSENLRETLFAHTKSNTDSFALLGELTVGYRFARLLEHLWVDLLTGSRQELYSMTALGAKGEYLNDGAFERVEISEEIEAADYRVVHILPFVGSRLVVQPAEFFRMLVSARLHALLSFSHDDHLLRKKDAFGRAHGAGLSVLVAPELTVVGPLSLGLSSEVFYLRSVTGVLKQEFYADDPETPQNELNGSVPNSNFAVRSLRFQGMGFARLAF